MIRFTTLTLAWLWSISSTAIFAADPNTAWSELQEHFSPPAEFAGKFGDYDSPLKFYDGTPVENAFAWSQRRHEIRTRWHSLLGAWPPLIERRRIEIVESSPRENFMQHRVRVEVASGQMLAGYLLVPEGGGPFPAVVVPYYDPETSIGLKGELRDFALQLSRRGFVSLSIGSPGGDARKPDRGVAICQPPSYLGYIAANCYNALAIRPEVDAKRIGIVGHSYGGKWALFGSCLYDKFACAVWSDPGVVFEEARGSVNYWEPWYLGLEAGRTRKPGLITADPPAHTATVANNRGELTQAVDDPDSDWVYVRFVPPAVEVAVIRSAGRRTIIAGPTVVGLEQDHWTQAAAAGVDAVLTDYPLELRRRLAGRGD